MAKIRDFDGKFRGQRVFFRCHCRRLHVIDLTRHKWNGSYDRPTFNPSLKQECGDGHVCHSWARDGQQQFLDDCTHELRGKTVEMREQVPP